MCQLKRPRANEITESLALTVCKLSFAGKRLCYSHVSAAHTHTVVNKRGFNEALVSDNKESDDDLLTADTSRDEALAASFSER